MEGESTHIRDVVWLFGCSGRHFQDDVGCQGLKKTSESQKVNKSERAMAQITGQYTE
jgi:hypothetical protein